MKEQSITPRLLSVEKLMQYTGLGRVQADLFGQQAGAKIRQGKRVLYDKKRIDQEIERRAG